MKGKFYDFSYGFRKGKNYHEAIRKINQIIMTKKISFISALHHEVPKTKYHERYESYKRITRKEA